MEIKEIKKNANKMFNELAKSEKVTTVMWENEEHTKILVELTDGYKTVLNAARTVINWTFDDCGWLPWGTRKEEARKERYERNKMCYKDEAEMDKYIPLKKAVFWCGTGEWSDFWECDFLL